VTIKIEDLDEFEGLTADMVRAWLRAKGWTVKRAERFWEWWEKGAEGEKDGFWLPAEFGRQWFWIHALAAVYGLSVQSLLGEINPRMRAGWPTDEELERHAFWMVRTPPDDRIHVLGAYVACEWKRAGLKVECWPCDQHGNKTRRGA
jgi:hypothetical protein